MSILSKYFDKVYCVNLNRRPDRWEKVQSEFAKFGFDEVERYEAIDGKDFDWSNIKYNPSLLVGELGLVETNINIIKEAIEKKYKSVLIFEDDVYFTDEINKLDEYINEPFDKKVGSMLDITPLKTQHSLERILNIQPVTYKMINDVNNKPIIGLVAQQVQSVISHCVDESVYTFDTKYQVEDASGNLVDTPINKLSINYQDISIHLIGAVQEQQNQINALTAFIQSKFPDYMSGNIINQVSIQ